MGETTQETKVAQIREVIESIRGVSVELRDKSFELTTSHKIDEEAGKEAEKPPENVSNELLSSLRYIRGVLREAFDTFSAFV